jgi:Protein of unknown function (DUF3048).
VGNRAPWGATYADIIYETPLHRNGFTRLSFLFSDLIPDSVGPVRSARVGHVDLREEWDAGFLYYGGQTRKGSNIEERFREYGANDKGVLFSGIVGNNRPWKQYYTRVSGVVSPHNVDANVAAMYELIDPSFTPPNHAFLFTDKLPATGESAKVITIDWGAAMYNSRFIYDVNSNQYFRYMLQKDGTESGLRGQVHPGAAGVSNLIVQNTTVNWNGSSDAPVTVHIGEGNADIFMSGKVNGRIMQARGCTSRTRIHKYEWNESGSNRKNYLEFPREHMFLR